jgi:hypothetical protein
LITLNEEGKRVLADIAVRYKVDLSAVEHLFAAVLSGHGTQAQFNHPDLGGMGQWSQGGMTMIGDMFNGNLKAKVADICTELAHLGRNGNLQQTLPASSQTEHRSAATSIAVSTSNLAGNWWPEALGHAASTGAQNVLRYAFFPSTHRLAIGVRGHVTIYDTGDHQIGGVSQQQGGGQSITFTSQHGLLRVADLQQVDLSVQQPERASQTSAAPPAQPTDLPVSRPTPAHPSAPLEDDIFAKIERLAALHAKGILQDEEFHAKKRELLDRL